MENIREGRGPELGLGDIVTLVGFLILLNHDGITTGEPFHFITYQGLIILFRRDIAHLIKRMRDIILTITDRESESGMTLIHHIVILLGQVIWIIELSDGGGIASLSFYHFLRFSVDLLDEFLWEFYIFKVRLGFIHLFNFLHSRLTVGEGAVRVVKEFHRIVGRLAQLLLRRKL